MRYFAKAFDSRIEIDDSKYRLLPRIKINPTGGIVTNFGRIAVIVMLTLGIPPGAISDGSAPALSEDPAKPFILVAQPRVNDPAYKKTVTYVKPGGNGEYVELIINRPTRITLGKLFPKHAPSQNVADPVYFGGPFNASAIFALVRSKTHPGDGSFKMTDGIYLVANGMTIDNIIETKPEDARFFVGAIVWKPGEMAEEMRHGMWHAIPATDEIVFGEKNSEKLWDELIFKITESEKMI